MVGASPEHMKKRGEANFPDLGQDEAVATMNVSTLRL